MSNVFDKKESWGKRRRKNQQDKALVEMVKIGYEKSARVKKMLDDAGINPTSIKSREDLERLPVTSRERLVEMEQQNPPYAGLENPDIHIDRIFTSPGPVYEPHLSETDYLWARAFFAAGIRPDDVALNAFSYHLVAAGLTFHSGLRRVGATVVPSGASSSQIQVQLIKDLKVTAYVGTPSFLKAIIEKSKEMGFDFKKDFGVKKACFAAEPLFPDLRRTFENDYGIDTYQMYGATEVGDVAYECSEKKGWHICEETIVEIVDPATGKNVPEGELGEVVVTRLNNIFFLLRFGTGDLSRLITESCPCGRTSYRLAGIAGRVGDAVKVRGLFVAPSQLKMLQAKFNNLPLQAVVSRTGHDDVLKLRIEKISPEIGSASWEENFKKAFREICTVGINNLEYLNAGEIKPEEKMILDQRQY
ncbi:MAG TPA: AMP-binding protein [Smithella sp.]|mgnify:FL=1|jgi:phenylacetate-CoA ligase|nr:AMP-binding protein [Smithella sp.]HOG08893.1 AMP-binding protein [Smithella sp.]HOS14249.1 AMP-binding protein [Smithella sp.]HOX98417.1 AMP-binding protein [Smithella sp.]HPL46652.1 AMP-binding protein [Smithella sp.]